MWYPKNTQQDLFACSSIYTFIPVLACMSGLSLLQEMTKGLASYPSAGVWRSVASPLETLDAELLVEIRQDQSEL